MIYRGQTLFSLLLTIGLTALLGTVMMKFFSTVQQHNQRLFLRLKLQAELQRVLHLIAKDVRRTGFRAVGEKVITDNLGLFEQESFPKSIRLGQVNGEPPNSCVLFFYDLNKSGCLGNNIKNGYCVLNGKNQTNDIKDELFGYRLNKKRIEVRSGYKGNFNQRCSVQDCQRYLQPEECNSTGWNKLLDDTEFDVTRFRFTWLVEKRGLELQLTGNLKSFSDITYTSSAIIPLFNEMNEN
ncbi:hypothetical protein RYD26_03945 [Pasteurellaceae bacterium LIM206]|nr:hypothetical protein [Pasteurellaceae bacterium LIM206]